MSLNFDTRNMSESNKDILTTADGYWSPAVELMAFATMRVDIGNIKDEVTAQTFFDRYLQWEFSMGRRYDKEHDSMTLELCYKFIGFSTNVLTTTDAAYAKRIRANIEATAWRMVQEQANDIQKAQFESEVDSDTAPHQTGGN